MTKAKWSEENDWLPRPGWFIAFAIATIALGVVSLAYAGISTLASVVVYGWVLIFSGAMEIGAAFWAVRAGRVLFHLLGGTLSAIVGVLILTHPALGAEALTFALCIMFLATGLYRLVAAFVLQFARWGWAVLSSVITIVLGLIILTQWPAASVWVLGTFVGVDLISRGFAAVMLAIAAHKVRHDLLHPA